MDYNNLRDRATVKFAALAIGYFAIGVGFMLGCDPHCPGVEMSSGESLERAMIQWGLAAAFAVVWAVVRRRKK